MKKGTRGAKIELRYLGLAPLVFSFFSFIKLPSADTLSFNDPLSPLYFFLFYLGAALIVFVSFLTAAHFNRTTAFRIPAIVCILPIIIGIGLCFAYGVTGFGLPFQFALGAAFVGVGSALLLIMWGYAWGFLDKQSIVPTIAAVFALAYLLKLLTAPFLAGSFNLLITGAAIILSALPLDSLTRQPQTADKSSERENALSEKNIFQVLWRPLLACALLCLIWGSTWGSALVGSDILADRNQVISLSEIVTILTPTIICLLFLWKQFTFNRNFILSTAVGLLILAWLLRFLGSTPGDYLGDILSGIAFGLLPLLLWTWCCEAFVGQPKNTQRACILSQAFITILILFSFAATLAVGVTIAELAAPVCSIILFIMYTANPFPRHLKEGSFTSSEVNMGGFSGIPAPEDILGSGLGLTPRESEICSYFARGHSTKYIAEQLSVSQNTVKTHVKRIYEKMGISSKDELIALLNNFPHDAS